MATRAELETQASGLGILNPAGFANVAELQSAIDAASDSDSDSKAGPRRGIAAHADDGVDVAAVEAYLADPASHVHPAGVSINFGDPVHYRAVSE